MMTTKRTKSRSDVQQSVDNTVLDINRKSTGCDSPMKDYEKLTNGTQNDF